MLRILNLGAGVQSTTLLLMSCKGELPKLDCAIFADTGWESDETYQHLNRLRKNCQTPIYIVNGGNIRSDGLISRMRGLKSEGNIPSSMPYFSPSGNGRARMKRQCTSDYKVIPIERLIIRKILDIKPHGRRPKECKIEQWFGISIDEVQRMRTSSEPWKINHYPLCGHPVQYLPKPYSRSDCLEWLAKNWAFPVPRSACLGCPYHSDSEWRKIKANPIYWDDVVAFDRTIRNSGGLRGELYLHCSLTALDEVDFSTAEDRGQLNLFNNECQGLCGI